MKVLMITGDRSFKAGNPRYDLQKSAVEELAVVYWGRGAWWPHIPAGYFDVVTTQDARWRGLLGWFIARMKRARLNVQVHGDIGASKKYFTFVLRHADSIRVVSGKIKRQVEKIGVHAPVTVLPIYKDTSEFEKIVPEPHEGKIIVWLGRFEPEKNPEGAIEVLKEVRKTVPGARLIMLGSGSMEGRLRARAAGLPVEFPGWQDPKTYLAAADAVLSTSWHESWGESIIEALAAGVPVVAPEVGIAKEAGAIIKARSDLALGVAEALRSGTRGELHVSLLSKQDWILQWRNNL